MLFLLLFREMVLPTLIRYFVGGICERDSRDIVVGFGNETHVVGPSVCGEKKVCIEARFLGFDHDDRRRSISLAKKCWSDVPPHGIADMWLTDQPLARLQLDGADSQWGTH